MWLVLACLLVPGSLMAAQSAWSGHTLPLVTPASNRAQQGIVRIINHSHRAGTVRIHAIDDAGRRFGPISLALGAGASVHFNSADLESGNRAKGLSGGVGDGEGDWRLELSTTLDIEPLAYIRTPDGFVTAMHDLAAQSESMRHHIPFFNPGSNRSQVSRLRLINPSDTDARVEIYGLDDSGERSGDVGLTVPAGEARTVGTRALESGGSGLSGRLGDGTGKWRLFVSADVAIEVMNLLESPTGHLSNLSGPGLRDLSGERRELELPLFVSASDDVRQGFARLLNHSETSGTVRIYGIDDEGRRAGPVVLTLAPREAAHFNSGDLERGNAAKGLSGELGAGSGSWRLQLYSELDLEALAYVRTSDGFVTAIHERVRWSAMRHHVAFFNPGSNASQVSLLRLINPGEEEVAVTIQGHDDEGEPAPGGEVRLTLGAGEARTLSAQALESGGDDLAGSLGDGAGKWQLFVSADAVIKVMNLLRSPTGHLANLSTSSRQAAGSGGVSTTPDNRILVELAPEDATAANLFDLNGRTLIFTPDGRGGYMRSVQPVVWEHNIGQPVADGAEVQLRSFKFDFAGRRWGRFLVSRHGLITFGGPLTYEYWDSENRFGTMRGIAGNLIDVPTISPLYKPMLGGRSDRYEATQHVAISPDRVVVTWITTEPNYHVHGVPPTKPSRFQLVLMADGGIAFNYADVALRDGIVGLFPDEEVTKGRLIARIADPTDFELPGHLDLLDLAIYESDTDALIVEWTMRDRIPSPPNGTNYSYRLYFDTDEPYFDGDEDFEFMWSVDVATDDSWTRGGRRLPTSAANRIALLVEDTSARGITASIKPDAAQFDDGRFVQGNWKSRSAQITLPDVPPAVDLSRPDGRFSSRQSEVFHYRSLRDLDSIVCRVVGILGDEFDLFVFHSEFRVDSQESSTPWHPYGGTTNIRGAGDIFRRHAPCGEGRLLGRWELPVWIESDHVWNDARARYHNERTGFDRGLLLFAHEFTHVWTAHASFINRRGEREPLYGNYCQCHWRWDLHAPAAFPWHEDEAGPRSLMGGLYWHENGDGTFTRIDGYWGGGHSWLDLYMIGLAEAREVPDMFILRNLHYVNEGDRRGTYTGDKEIVTIEQVVAAEGPRIPSTAESQKDFNAAFVYLLEPGRTPDPDMLRLHAEYRDKVIEHWSHVTGGRSRMTTTVPDVTNRSPLAVRAGMQINP